MCELGCTHNDADYFMNLIQTRPGTTIANMAIILINQADYLLYRQLKRLSEDFLKDGGFLERMSAMCRQSRSTTGYPSYPKNGATNQTPAQNNSTHNSTGQLNHPSNAVGETSGTSMNFGQRPLGSNPQTPSDISNQ